MTTVTTSSFVNEMITVGDAAVSLVDLGFDSQVVKDSDALHIQVTEGSSIRYWYSGAAPTVSEGFLLTVGSERIFRGFVNIGNLRMISANVGQVAVAAISIGRRQTWKAP